jgi:hypothetical protein
MFEACEALGLVLGVHPSPPAGHTITGAGWPSFYFEDHSGFPQAVPTHVASLICEGALDRFPGLRIVMIESGWSYAPWLRARLDGTWRVMRDEIVEVERPPSEYLREHFWFTTQPAEEPEQQAWLAGLLENCGLDDRLMYSSDYPHWDFDAPEEAIPVAVDPGLRRKFLFENACALYGLDLARDA